MVIQLLLGGVLVVLNSMIAGGAAIALLYVITHQNGWMVHGRRGFKLIIALILCTLCAILIVTLCVAVWATAFLLLGLFPDVESAVYFSLVVFTTLGFGDLLMPQEWRILGAIMAVNGILNIGILTAVVLESLRSLHQRQREADETRS